MPALQRDAEVIMSIAPILFITIITRALFHVAMLLLRERIIADMPLILLMRDDAYIS